MDKVIHTNLVIDGKSTYVIDTVKDLFDNKIIKIRQIIENNDVIHEIKLRPTAVSELIIVLQNLDKELMGVHSLPKSLNHKDIINRYFKCLSIKDVALQFNCSEKIIEKILLDHEIDIVDNSLASFKPKFWHRKRKR